MKILKFIGQPLEKITIDSTNDCNLSCRLCFIGKIRRQGKLAGEKAKFFPLPLFLKLCRELKKHSNGNDVSVGLSGGEPFLCPGIKMVIKQAYKEKLKFFIFTNGTLLDPYVELLTEFPPPTLIFSLDGLKIENDTNRGKGDFIKAARVIDRINRFKDRKRAVKPRLAVNAIVSRFNFKSFFNLVPWAEKNHIEKIFFSLVQWNDHKILAGIKGELRERYGKISGRTTVFDGLTNEFSRLRENEVSILIENIKKTKILAAQAKKPLSVNFFPDFSDVNEYYNWFSRVSFKIDYCANIFRQIRIDFNGNVSAGCGVPIFILGNLNKDGLQDILNSRRARNFADDIRKNGYFYACGRCCRRPGESHAVFDK